MAQVKRSNAKVKAKAKTKSKGAKKFALKNDPYSKRETQRYAKPIPSREYILDYLQQYARAVTYRHLCRVFELSTADGREAMQRRLAAMARDGQLITNRRGSYALASQLSLVRGLVLGHKDGYGFLEPEDGGDDIFLTAQQMRSLFPGDRVLVRQLAKGRRGRSEGIVVEILERNTSKLVGRYFVESGIAFITPVNKNIAQDIIIPSGFSAGAHAGQLVEVAIESYPTERHQATGKVTEIIGEHMAPGAEIAVAVRVHNLPHVWSDEVIDTAQKLELKRIAADIEGRKDLRELPFVTIDGEDAKDFDDAVYCEKNTRGGWRLYVAIADVSYYVKPESALDKEALSRGNSVYFPGSVIPMLPEIISNELCSLKPDVDRLCMVCDMSIDKQGKIMRYKFYEGIIKSAARLTYTQVARALAGNGAGLSQLMPHLQELHKLYSELLKERNKRGAIEFETIESRIIFTKERKIKKIVAVERNDAHRIIEECMLAANVCAAKYLLQRKIPALYRVHLGPDAEKLTNLRSSLSVLGLKLGGGMEPKPKDYAIVIEKIKDRPDRHLIQTMLLRSMRQAVYDAENLGHFGLAYEAYGHFTSPIRRYPDLVTHRAIKHALCGGTLDDFHYDNAMVHNFGEHCSMTERRADNAVSDAVLWLKCEYMLNKVGKSFDGIISGVCNFGIFVELKDIFVEGLVHITALENDYYELDDVRHCLHGKRTGSRYCLGDTVRVMVARVDLDEREIDFELV